MHKSVNSEYKGELTLVHENIDLKRERLIISIPLKIINDASKEYSLAQDVFYQIRRKIKTQKKRTGVGQCKTFYLKKIILSIQRWLSVSRIHR